MALGIKLPGLPVSVKRNREMALSVLFLITGIVSAANINEEMMLTNVTRYAAGDLFSLRGSDCGPTRCMELTHGTAMAALSSNDACLCQCRRDTPAFREDQKICVNHIEECPMASFGRGVTKPQIPFAFLPLKGQIIYPSKEIVFTDVDDAICAVTSAQYLSPSGWVTLRDLLDNDVPFSLYRDEGSTFLQWRGSTALHARLEGRLVAAHVLCSAPAPTRLAASCAAFRVAGGTHHPMFDVPSIPFHAGEVVATEQSQNQGLSVIESLAIGVCILLLIFVYAAGIIFYIHYKKRQKRKDKDPENNTLSTENGSNLGSRIDLDNVMLKTNPLLKLDNLGDFMNDAGLSDVSERTEETLDSSASTTNSHKFQKLNSSVISAMVHTRRMKKPGRPSVKTVSDRSSLDRMNERLQRRSASPEIERAPHSELAIVDYSMEHSMVDRTRPIPEGEPAMRRKLYFNPVFFETQHLKNPPPAAIEFLIKIREVMSIAKERVTAKRFIPSLSDIPEEESYHTFDLGWDIPCARRGRRFSVISLKRENSRRVPQCSGCPGCDKRDVHPNPVLIRSNSCKSYVSDEYKQRIVRKWLDEVPSPTPASTATRPVKSVAKVSGTPRNGKPKNSESTHQMQDNLSETQKSIDFAQFDPKEQIKSLRVKELPLQTGVTMVEVEKMEIVQEIKKEPKDVKYKNDAPVVVEMSVKKESKENTVIKETSLEAVIDLKHEMPVKGEISTIKEINVSKEEKVLDRIETDLKEAPAAINTVNEIKEKQENTKKVKRESSQRLPKPDILKEISAKIVKEITIRNDSAKDNNKKENPKEVIKDTSVKKDLMKMFSRKEQPKETVHKRDFRTEKPKIIHNVPLDEESGMIQEVMKSHNLDNSSVGSEPQSPALSTASSSGKTSSSHLSQRLRRKLPPPPPPPVTKQLLPKIEVTPESPLPTTDDESIPSVASEVKIKMKAVIQELSKCKRESAVEEEVKVEQTEPIPTKIVIPVVAADTHYYSDDNMLSGTYRKYIQQEPFVDFDSIERKLKKRRFSLACEPELARGSKHVLFKADMQETLTRSWRDVRKAGDNCYQFMPQQEKPMPLSRRYSVSQVFVDNEPLYDNIMRPGPLSIQVRGSPGEVRRNDRDEFDQDTLDRQPAREAKKRVEKMLIKSGGSFKHKTSMHEQMNGAGRIMPAPGFSREIGSLREIYESKPTSHEKERGLPYYGRRGSVPYENHDLASLVKSIKASDLIRQIEAQKDGIKPPVPPKQRRGPDLSPKFGERRATRTTEERERYQMYLRGENLKRSGRRCNRTRSRRTDLRKLYRTEDSGYLSTDSNESKRRASYLMQLRPKAFPEQTAIMPHPTVVRTPILQHIESDTDDMESVCDGRSESGGESIETDSVFFGNYDESKQMLAELGLSHYDLHRKMHHHEQIDSGFMGETNIILSGDSDSEHRSVISIVTGRDGRASAASITQLEDAPYLHSVEC